MPPARLEGNVVFKVTSLPVGEKFTQTATKKCLGWTQEAHSPIS